MTYKEANELIKENENRVRDLITHQTPGKDVLGFIVAPPSISGNTAERQYFFEHCIEKNENNESALSNLLPGLADSNQLAPFVVLKTNNHIAIIPLEDYLLFLATTELGNES